MVTQEALFAALRKELGGDEPRIRHAEEVWRHARAIMEEHGGDNDVVMEAAVLMGIGTTQARKKHASVARSFQAIEGPPIARRILRAMEEIPEIVDEVCEIITFQNSEDGPDTDSFNVVHDADLIATLCGEHAGKPLDWKREAIEDRMRTESGKSLARSLVLGEE